MGNSTNYGGLKISVAIPCFNEAAYIEQAIESALSQGPVVSEVCVFDNCSDDGTWSTLLRLAECHPKLKINQHNAPVSPFRNIFAAIETATAELVLLLGADDYLLPNSLTELVKLMDSDDEILGIQLPWIYLMERADTTSLATPPNVVDDLMNHSALVEGFIRHFDQDGVILSIWRRDQLMKTRTWIRDSSLEPFAWWWALATLCEGGRTHRRFVTASQAVFVKRTDHLSRTRPPLSSGPQIVKAPRFSRHRILRSLQRRSRTIMNGITLGAFCRLGPRLTLRLALATRHHSIECETKMGPLRL